LELQTYLREGFADSTNFCDGEILRHIRLYQARQDARSENKWWSRLSRDKKKDLKALLKINGFCDVFDDLMNITGLWPPFHIGTFRRYLTLNCHEVYPSKLWFRQANDGLQELLNYLRRTYTVWSTIAAGDPNIMQIIDLRTVEALELRAPKASTEDAAAIDSGMESRELFSSISDPATRENIRRRIMEVDHLIPSLRTFCEDTKSLEPCANAMKLLVTLERRETVDRAFRRIYSRPNGAPGKLVVQTQLGMEEVDIDEDDRFRLSLLQLFLVCMRSFDNMINVACRKDKDEAKPLVTAPNAIVISRFAQLAHQLGFDSDKIRRLKSMDSKADEIYSFLCRLDPEDEVDEDRLHAETQQHLNLWQSNQNSRMSKITTGKGGPSLTIETKDQKLSERCGRPFWNAHVYDRQFMFLRWIYDKSPVSGRYITSFFVKRSVFIAFFGDFHEVAATMHHEEAEASQSENVDEVNNGDISVEIQREEPGTSQSGEGDQTGGYDDMLVDYYNRTVSPSENGRDGENDLIMVKPGQQLLTQTIVEDQTSLQNNQVGLVSSQVNIGLEVIRMVNQKTGKTDWIRNNKNSCKQFCKHLERDNTLYSYAIQNLNGSWKHVPMRLCYGKVNKSPTKTIRYIAKEIGNNIMVPENGNKRRRIEHLPHKMLEQVPANKQQEEAEEEEL